MTTIDERQWRSYLLAKAAAERMPKLSMQEKERMVRKSIRDNFRQRDDYDRDPKLLYDKLKRQEDADSIRATPEQARACRARSEKILEEDKARRREFEAREAKATEEFQAKHPEIVEEMTKARKERDQGTELVKRVYNEEVERLKTLPVVKKNPIKELIEAIQFRFYVVRRFGFRYKGKSVKIGPEDYAVRSPDRR